MFSIKNVTPADVPLLLTFIRHLAVYEKMENEVVATEAQLHTELFERASAHAVLAYENEIPVGFALYFFNFSTFLSKRGLYLEDLFVLPEYRGRGYGKALLMHLKHIAQQEQCGRMEWSVLNWNQPAIDFYESLGAKPMNEWTVYRLNPSI
ncbi:MAG: GNAT family N-acetyltransferase [Chitinophagaceae bacterium]